MATTRKTTMKNTTNTDIEKCIIKCEPRRELACGYTKVKIMPNNYSKIILVAGITSKSIQDLTNELLEYAINNASIQVDEDTIVNVADIGR